MKGRIHSLQSLGAVDGPGLRYVIFLQGCPLRCIYCHNPDTWDFSGGEEYEVEELVEKILRCKGYFGKNGGVTVTGGEPLAQWEFVYRLFKRLHEENIHTALDTSGIGDLDKAGKVLSHTDLVLLDIKFTTDEQYKKNCRGSLCSVLKFAALTAELNVPLWVRHVVAPGLNDNVEDMKRVEELASGCPNLEKLEWLPFHNLCIEKYQRMGIDFPMKGTPPMEDKRLQDLISCLYGEK